MMANHEEPALSEAGWHAQLLPLWRRFLKTEDISIDDDFFEKGGDSILAIDLQLELQRAIGRELPESLLFEASTIRELARRLSQPAGVRRAPVIRTTPGDVQPPLSIAEAKAAAKHGVAADQAPASFAARRSAND